MPSKETFCIEVRGDYACFTRPEMKVERVSYDAITPSAARGIFEAILWKPAIRWQVTKIEVLKPIRWVNIRRNEVASRASQSAAKSSGGITVEDDRQQRAGLFLRDVAYRLHARFQLQDDSGHVHRYPELRAADSETENSYMKFAAMFNRRAERGQCFNQPYLGTREFAADWQLVDAESEAARELDLEEDRPLGWMLYDMDYSDPKSPAPRFFNPVLKTDGTIDVPAWNSDEVRG